MKIITTIALALFTLPTLSYATAIKLISADEINAEIIEKTDLYIRVNHDVLGELTINTTQILSINNEIISSPTITTPQEKSDNGLFGTGILPDWERNLTIGLNGKDGNTRALDIHSAFDADIEEDNKRWDLGIYYNFSKKNGESTQDDFKISITRDWLLPNSQWFYFASGKYDWDKFKSWDYRLTGIVGAGYEFIETDSFSLIGRTGIAGKKNYGSDDDNFEPELMTGLGTDWTISKVQSLAFKTEFFTPFEQARDFRNLTKLDWKFKLDTSMDLSFKLGLENEYESIIDAGAKHNDFQYRVALILGL